MNLGVLEYEGNKRPCFLIVWRITTTPAHWNCWSFSSQISVTPASDLILRAGLRALILSNWHSFCCWERRFPCCRWPRCEVTCSICAKQQLKRTRKQKVRESKQEEPMLIVVAVWSDKVKCTCIYMQNCWFSIWDVATRSACWVLIWDVATRSLMLHVCYDVSCLHIFPSWVRVGESDCVRRSFLFVDSLMDLFFSCLNYR